MKTINTIWGVSTHSRLKAAGRFAVKLHLRLFVSTHSRLKAAGEIRASYGEDASVSTHSRLKAAGANPAAQPARATGFNTQPPEGGWGCRTRPR